MHFSIALGLAASATIVAADQAYLGFNSGATNSQGAAKKQADFETEFSNAQKLAGAPGLFNSVRLYTNIQSGSTDDPIEAFPAAIKTNSTLLLGMWTSGTTNITLELNALNKAIKQYGDDFTKLVVGLSVGSEDLYRVSENGERNKAGVGQPPDVMVNFINDAKKNLTGTALSKIPVGHVDTWDSWANGTNKAVIDAVDWVGVDSYPYYQNNTGNIYNAIENASSIFDDSITNTKKATGNKPIWITETGWPVSGPQWGFAKPSVDNAKIYWDQVGCGLFGKTNVWWYELSNSNPANSMEFAITTDGTDTPAFNLTCPANTTSSSSNTTSPINPAGNGNTNSSQNTGSGSGNGSSSSGGKSGGKSAASSVSMSMGSLVVGLLVAAWVL